MEQSQREHSASQPQPVKDYLSFHTAHPEKGPNMPMQQIHQLQQEMAEREEQRQAQDARNTFILTQEEQRWLATMPPAPDSTVEQILQHWREPMQAWADHRKYQKRTHNRLNAVRRIEEKARRIQAKAQNMHGQDPETHHPQQPAIANATMPGGSGGAHHWPTQHQQPAGPPPQASVPIGPPTPLRHGSDLSATAPDFVPSGPPPQASHFPADLLEERSEQLYGPSSGEWDDSGNSSGFVPSGLSPQSWNLPADHLWRDVSSALSDPNLSADQLEERLEQLYGPFSGEWDDPGNSSGFVPSGLSPQSYLPADQFNTEPGSYHRHGSDLYATASEFMLTRPQQQTGGAPRPQYQLQHQMLPSEAESQMTHRGGGLPVKKRAVHVASEPRLRGGGLVEERAVHAGTNGSGFDAGLPDDSEEDEDDDDIEETHAHAEGLVGGHAGGVDAVACGDPCTAAHAAAFPEPTQPAATTDSDKPSSPESHTEELQQNIRFQAGLFIALQHFNQPAWTTNSDSPSSPENHTELPPGPPEPLETSLQQPMQPAATTNAEVASPPDNQAGQPQQIDDIPQPVPRPIYPRPVVTTPNGPAAGYPYVHYDVGVMAVAKGHVGVVVCCFLYNVSPNVVAGSNWEMDVVRRSAVIQLSEEEMADVTTRHALWVGIATVLNLVHGRHIMDFGGSTAYGSEEPSNRPPVVWVHLEEKWLEDLTNHLDPHNREYRRLDRQYRRQQAALDPGTQEDYDRSSSFRARDRLDSAYNRIVMLGDQDHPGHVGIRPFLPHQYGVIREGRRMCTEALEGCLERDEDDEDGEDDQSHLLDQSLFCVTYYPNLDPLEQQPIGGSDTSLADDHRDTTSESPRDTTSDSHRDTTSDSHSNASGDHSDPESEHTDQIPVTLDVEAPGVDLLAGTEDDSDTAAEEHNNDDLMAETPDESDEGTACGTPDESDEATTFKVQACKEEPTASVSTGSRVSGSEGCSTGADQEHTPKADKRASPNADDNWGSPEADSKRSAQTPKTPSPKARNKRSPKAGNKRRSPNADNKRSPQADKPTLPTADNKRSPKPDKKRSPKPDKKGSPQADKHQSPKTDNQRSPKADTKGSLQADGKGSPQADKQQSPKADKKCSPKADKKRSPTADQHHTTEADAHHPPGVGEQQSPKADKKDTPDNSRTTESTRSLTVNKQLNPEASSYHPPGASTHHPPEVGMHHPPEAQTEHVPKSSRNGGAYTRGAFRGRGRDRRHGNRGRGGQGGGRGARGGSQPPA